MNYRGNSAFSHQQADKVGVLLTNLGTPDAPTKAALKPYLKEFLSDPRVVEFPRWTFVAPRSIQLLAKRSDRTCPCHHRLVCPARSRTG